jgi:hypothetical protein
MDLFMRLSYRTHLLKTDSDTAYGFYAEADFCAEHEHGLGRLYRDMGCADSTVEGIGRYQPSEEVASSGRFPVLSTGRFWNRDDKGRKKTVTRALLASREVNPDYMPEGGYAPRGSSQATTWFSEHGFLVMAQDVETESLINSLHHHAGTRDIAVFMGGGGFNAFSRGGIVIVIPSLVPIEHLESLRASHANARLLEEAAGRTGIRERITEKQQATMCGRWLMDSPYHLYGIKPDWAKSIKSRGEGDAIVTEHEVIFWINSGRGIYGWYTVEELDKWLDGSGPVIRDAQERSKSAAA